MTDEKPETPRERLLRMHEDMCKQARATMRKKSADYATEEDPLANFRRFGPLGIVCRLDDKLSRLANFVKRGVFDVEDESLADTLRDLLNYSVLLAFFVAEEKTKKPA